MVIAICLIPLLPFLGATLILLFNRKLPHRLVTMLCCGSVLGSFALSLSAALNVAQTPTGSIEFELASWMPAFGANWGILLDPLTTVMILIVTGIGFLIHVYSASYMSGDDGYARYFGCLNLFVAAMLLLVMANSYLLLFIGWEGVGLASYLLIGFWYHRPTATNAATKAFLVNRIGDVAFLIGMLLVFHLAGTLCFTGVAAALTHLTPGPLVTTAAALVLVGAMGKSAQFPLHVWLPDAMEGPTPVSALIHAATMVTAGVYLIARSAPLFRMAPEVLTVMGAIGGITAIFAASIAIFQHDIKRLLAFSTLSQLGYMFMALGVGAFSVAIFHVFTHAFFKALLFLGAGSVIHALAGEQDMRKMGGLKAPMPVTFRTMTVAALAITGIPGFAGFFSKDEILWRTWRSSTLLSGIGLITALLTAMYTWRMISLTFFGEARSELVAHESPRAMTLPLIALATGSIFAGWIVTPFQHWLQPAYVPSENAAKWWFIGVSLGLSLIGIDLGRRYRALQPTGTFSQLLFNAFYIDDLYDVIFVRGFAKRGGSMLARFDRRIVDGGVNGAGFLTRTVSRASMWWDAWVIDGAVQLTALLTRMAAIPVRAVQTGSAQAYALMFLGGLAVMFGCYLASR